VATENKASFIQKIKEKWNALTPQQKKKSIVILGASIIILISILGYMATHSGKAPQEATKKETGKVEEIRLDTGVLQKTQLAESQKEIEALKAQIEALKKEKEKES